MGRQRHVICAVDLRDPTPAVVEHAAAAASVHRADLVLAYVFHAPLPLRMALPQYAGDLLDSGARADFVQRLELIAGPVRERGVPVRTRVLEGRPAQEIVRLAETLNVDLVVVGTHGRSGVGRLVLGSVAEETIRSANCPVMIVGPRMGEGPGPARPEPSFARILCAVDFSPESRAALDEAVAFADATGGTVRVLHVVEWWAPGEIERFEVTRNLTTREEVIRQARAQLDGFVPPASRARVEVLDVALAERPYTAVLAEASAQPTDLIVLGVRGRGAIDRLVTGSTTNRVVREAPCPVLTVPGHAGAGRVPPA